MVNQKISFIDRIPDVLKIIEESDTPIRYTEIHEKLKNKTCVKISKHTLNKCLNHLIFSSHIDKKVVKARGHPVYYSINPSAYNFDFDVSSRRDHLLELLQNESLVEYDKHQCTAIDMHLSLLIMNLINQLSTYSKNNKRNEALEDYKLYLDSHLLPSLLKMTELVKPPLVITDDTHSKLHNMYNSVNHCLWINGISHNPDMSYPHLSEEEKRIVINYPSSP
jgi:hypothetical protein